MMPLAPTDYGNFSQSDPFRQILRAVADYYFGGRHGPGGVTQAANYLPAKTSDRLSAPVRIDLARSMLGSGQPPAPAGWTTQTVQGQEVPIGSGPNNIPMPEPGARVPMPEMGESNIPWPAQNPAFHDVQPPMPQMSPMSRELGPATAANPAIMRVAQAMMGRNSGAPFPQAAFNQFSPADLRNQPWTT